MKKLFLLAPLLMLLGLDSEAQPIPSTIWWAITNWSLGTLTNASKVTPVALQVTVDGNYAEIGLPKLFPSNGTGVWTNSMFAGNYRLDLVGLPVAQPIYFQVQTNGGTHNVLDGDTLISGGNFFVTRIVFTNGATTGTFSTIITSNIFTTNFFGPFITNNTLYSTNLYGPFITNFTLYSTNLITTNLTANYITNNTTFTTNLTVQNITNNTSYITNLFGPFITNFTLYSTNLITTNLTTVNFNGKTTITTNLFVSNAFFTNLTVDALTNNTFITTNAYISNAFITNLVATTITNNLFITTNLFSSNAFITNLTATTITNNTFYTTNAFISNAFITNIFLQVAQYTTNKWPGPTNDVDFVHGVYQQFTASTDMQITGFKSASPTNENTTVLLIDPGGANRTLYFPNNWTNYTIDKANAYPIGSTNIAIVTLSQYGRQYTNVIVRLWGVTASDIWINRSGTIGLVNNALPILLGDVGQSSLSDMLTLIDTNITGGTGVGMNIQANVNGGAAGNISGLLVTSLSGTPSDNSHHATIQSLNSVVATAVGATYFGNDSASAVYGQSGGASGHTLNNSATALNGYANGNDGLLVGMIGEADPRANGSTNVGVIANVLMEGKTGTFVGGYFEVDDSNGASNPLLESAGLLVDTRSSAVNAQVWRTNNGTTTAKMDRSGVLTANGLTDNSGTAGQLVAYQGGNRLGATNSVPSGFLPNDIAYVDKNNAWTSASSNYIASVTTYATNSNNTTPDMAISSESLLSTNNNFTWLAPIHVDQSGKDVQYTFIEVTNSSGSSITMTLPANVHQCNAGAGLVVTNDSMVIFKYRPPLGPTQFWHIPGY